LNHPFTDILLAAAGFVFWYLVCLWIIYLYKRPHRSLLFTNYFTKALLIKLAGLVSFVLIYTFYYKGGDTFGYFNGSQLTFQLLQDNPVYYFGFFSDSYYSLPVFYHFSQESKQFISAATTGMVVLITNLFFVVTFQNFLITSLLFCLVSLAGLWRLMERLSLLLPCEDKYIFYAIFGIPSVAFWTGGILKDTICITCVALTLSAIIDVIYFRRKYLLSFLLIGLSMYLLVIIKDYIFLSLAAGLLVWIFSYIMRYRLHRDLRYFIYLLFFVCFSYYLYYNYDTLYFQAYTMVVYFVQKAYGFQSWHEAMSMLDDGSSTGYTLGEIEFTISGVLSKVPASLFVAFFRPLPYEATKPIIFFQSLESLFFLLITLYTIAKSGFINFFGYIYSDPFLKGLLIFVLLIAFITGFTSFNFGALARYRIPMLPAYLLILFMVLYKSSQQQKRQVATLSATA